MLGTRHVKQALLYSFRFRWCLQRHFVSVCGGKFTRIETAINITPSAFAGFSYAWSIEDSGRYGCLITSHKLCLWDSLNLSLTHNESASRTVLAD